MAEQNSIDSYIDLIQTDELGEKQQIVYDYIKRNPNCTYNDVSRDLRQHHNTITARIRELRQSGYIVKSGDAIDPMTNKKNATYRVRRADELPDDTSIDLTPVMPRNIFNYLQSKIGESTGKEGIGDSRFVVSCNNGAVKLIYGGFVEIRNIVVACEDFEQNRYVISGKNFTMQFRIR